MVVWPATIIASTANVLRIGFMDLVGFWFADEVE
jgi:hypothetical protein